MGKRILFTLNFVVICLCVLSAQAQGDTAKSFPTKRAAQTTPPGKAKVVNVKAPVVAGKGLTVTKAATTSKPTVTAKTVTTSAVKTPTKTVTKAPAKTKKATTAKKAKSKAVTKKAVKTPVKAKVAPAVTTKAKTTALTTTAQTKAVPTQYATVATKTATKSVVLPPQAPVTISFSKEMLTAVNALRKSGTTCGGEKMPPVKSLAWSVQLENAAIAHVTDMDTHDHFSHAGTNGTLPDDRIKAAGYEWSRVGENIGQGYKDVSAAMKGWKESTNHCKQMMSADVINIGAAKKGKYWCQTFASPLE